MFEVTELAWNWAFKPLFQVSVLTRELSISGLCGVYKLL